MIIQSLDSMRKLAFNYLKKIAVKILKFSLLGRGKTPWAYYQGRDGKRYATFLKKDDLKDNQLEIELPELPLGCSFKKYSNPKSVEHRIYAYVKEFNGEEYYPKVQEVGTILVSSFNGIEAWMKNNNGINFDSINDAVNYLLRKINLKECREAYEYLQGGF